MEMGQKVGPFQIEKELGSGAMGSVYLARYENEGKQKIVALKVIAFGLLGNESAMARFNRESSILKQLRHQHIVRLFATGQYKSTPFIAMEYVDGQSLDKIMAIRDKMSWQEVCQLGQQLCEALQHAHDKGIIHRDLKPSNLMLTPDGVLKLTDFGIAKDSDVTALTGANSTIGTASYMSPEQCRGEKELTHKSDLYSLGVVFYELITGRKPFQADSTIDLFLKHVNEQAIRPSKLIPDLPVWMDNLIMFLLEKKKDDRPLDASTVGIMLKDIEEKVNNQQSVGVDVANARRVDRPINKKALDQSDRDAARSLRGGKKKRKKKRNAEPFFQRTWVKGLGLMLVLIAIAGGITYALWPQGFDAAYAELQQSPDLTVDDRMELVGDFLQSHGDVDDPRMAELREEYKQLATRRHWDILYKRFNSKFKDNAEGYPANDYQLAIRAMDAERAGETGRAAELWSQLRSAASELPDGQLLNDDALRASVLGWIAAQAVEQIRVTAPAELRRLNKEMTEQYIYQKPIEEYNPNDPESVARRAVRFTRMGDKPATHEKWKSLIGLTKEDPDNRVWYILAVEQAHQTEPAENAPDPDEARIKLLQDKIIQLKAAWKVVQQDRLNRGAEQRNIWNVSRDIVTLYEDSSEKKVKQIVDQARALVESTTTNEE